MYQKYQSIRVLMTSCLVFLMFLLHTAEKFIQSDREDAFGWLEGWDLNPLFPATEKNLQLLRSFCSLLNPNALIVGQYSSLALYYLVSLDDAYHRMQEKSVTRLLWSPWFFLPLKFIAALSATIGLCIIPFRDLDPVDERTYTAYLLMITIYIAILELVIKMAWTVSDRNHQELERVRAILFERQERAAAEARMAQEALALPGVMGEMGANEGGEPNPNDAHIANPDE